MRFHQNHVRGVPVGPVEPSALAGLAAVLTHQPVELLLTAQGAVLPSTVAGRSRQRLQDGASAGVALAKRNIRSLLCQSRDADEVAQALRIATCSPPRDAEDVLEDAGLEMNLRYDLFASPDASLHVQNRSLTVTNGAPASVRIARRDLQAQGGAYFCPQAIGRLLSLDVDEIALSPGAVSPVWMQLAPGAVMPPDTAHHHLHKGSWRAVQKPDFVKAYCVACGRCFVHCPDNAVIHATYDERARETTGILGVDTDRCTGCGLCATVCPTNSDGYKAIVMTEVEADSSPDLHRVG